MAVVVQRNVFLTGAKLVIPNPNHYNIVIQRIWLLRLLAIDKAHL
jgi:hypothetical protein